MVILSCFKLATSKNTQTKVSKSNEVKFFGLVTFNQPKFQGHSNAEVGKAFTSRMLALMTENNVMTF